MKKRRTWTAEQKLSILKEAEQHGVTATIRKHSLYANTYYKWKQNYECEGIEGLKNHRRRIEPELRKLQKENQRLKQLLADKELAISIQSDLLKKTTRNQKTNA
jgi:transposase-like protein